MDTTHAEGRQGSTWRRADWIALAGILAFAVLVPAVLGAMAGSLDIPHNDDFDYRRVALTLFTDGRLEMRGYNVMSLIGQVVAVQPVLAISGGSPVAFAVTTALFAIAGLAAAYDVVRRLLSPARTTLAVLSAVVVPGFLLNTTSFMTDVPAMATAFVCLALGAAAIERDGRIRWPLLAASLVAGCFAVSIRESTLGAPIAVVLVAAVADARGPRRLALAAVVVVATAAAIHLAGGTIPGQADVRFDPASGGLRLRAAFSTVALALVPALSLAIAWWRGRWLLVDLLPGLLFGLFVDWTPLTMWARTGRLPSMLIGNLFSLVGPDGSGVLDGSRPALYPPEVWSIVQASAFVATVLMPAVATGILGTVIRNGGITRARLRGWARSPASLLVIFTLLTTIGLAVYGYAFTMFDRYLWPLILAGSALLLLEPESVRAEDESAAAAPTVRGSNRARAARLIPTGLAGVGVGLLAVLSVMSLLASDAFSAARWRLGEAAVADGVPASHVDAGMEWVGYQAIGQATPYHPPRHNEMWYTGWWPSYHQCAVVTSRQLTRSNYLLVEAEPAAFRQYQFAGPALPLYLYWVVAPGCP